MMRRCSQFIRPGYLPAQPPAMSQPWLRYPCAKAGAAPAIPERTRFPTERLPDMTAPKTLLELAGADLRPPRLRDACLVLIDLQYEYLAGPIALPAARAAIANAAKLLARARAAGTSIFHIAHKGRPGGLFDRSAERGA